MHSWYGVYNIIVRALILSNFSLTCLCLIISLNTIFNMYVLLMKKINGDAAT